MACFYAFMEIDFEFGFYFICSSDNIVEDYKKLKEIYGKENLRIMYREESCISDLVDFRLLENPYCNDVIPF